MSLQPSLRPQHLAAPHRPAVAGQSAAVLELEGTLAKFQASLADEDRIKLQGLKATPNDAQSIITFTAELDGLDPKRRGRSIASKLMCFLQTVEQFVPIVDTMVQSKPELAALIWGSVKLAFLVLANFSSYFESFVELLHGFGNLCSRFAEYQRLFTDSDRVRDSVCRFHTSVILCCERIIVNLRCKTSLLVLKSLTQSFKTELRTYVEDIRTKAEIVREDVRLAKAQADHHEQSLQAKEREAAAENRKSVKAWFSSSSKAIREIDDRARRSAAERKLERLLEKLSSFNCSTSYVKALDKRHLGTAAWVFDTTEFQEWHNSKHSASLHVTGKIGSGKSVLTSSIIEHVYMHRKPHQMVSFCFSRFDDRSSLEANTIIRSLVQQVASRLSLDSLSPLLHEEFLRILQKTGDSHYSRQSIENLYAQASHLSKEWFVILDGIDECSKDEVQALLGFLSKINGSGQLHCKMKFLFSSRQTVTEEIRVKFPDALRLVTGSGRSSQDILTYTEDIINARKRSGNLVVQDDQLIKEILDTISTKEDGMFLWVFLAIEDICTKKNDREIRQALLEIPPDLPSVFDRVLSRIKTNSHTSISKRVFGWVAAARRPLTVAELREALSLEPGQQRFDPNLLPNGMERLAFWCENLVQIDELDMTVRFCHLSVLEHLYRSPIEPFHLDIEELELEAGQLCLTYLRFDNVRNALVERALPDPETALSLATLPVESIAGRTVRLAIPGHLGASVGRLVNRLISPPKPQSSLSPGHAAILPCRKAVVSQEDRHNENGATSIYPFLTYASEHWLSHIWAAKPSSFASLWGKDAAQILLESAVASRAPYMDLEWRREAITTVECEQPCASLVSTIPSDYGLSDATWALFFAFIHACLVGNHALLCQYFLMYSAIRPSEPYCPPAELLVFMVRKGHFSCGHRCLRNLVKRLTHRRFFSFLTELIAYPLTWGPTDLTLEEIRALRPQEQLVGLDGDILETLVSGYDPKEEPILQLFLKPTSRIAGQRHELLKCLRDESTFQKLAMSRTLSGKSFVSLVIELVSGRFGSEILVEFFDLWDSRILGKFKERQALIEEGFLSAIRVFNSGALESLQTANRSYSPPTMSQEIIKELANTLKYEWAFPKARIIIEHYVPVHTMSNIAITNYMALLRLCIIRGNWEFASAFSPPQSFLYGIGPQPQLEPGRTFLHAMQCADCRFSAPLPAFCNVHYRQAVLVLEEDEARNTSSDLAYMGALNVIVHSRTSYRELMNTFWAH